MVNNLTKCDLKTVTNIAITAIAAIIIRFLIVNLFVYFALINSAITTVKKYGIIQINHETHVPNFKHFLSNLS